MWANLSGLSDNWDKEISFLRDIADGQADGTINAPRPDLVQFVTMQELSELQSAPPPASQCVRDANGNGVGDIVDIMTTASEVRCLVYLPVVAANWRQPWPTPTLGLTATSR